MKITAGRPRSCSAATGKEIVKRQGYIEPSEMIAMLKAIIADPSPGPSVRPEVEVKFGENSLLPDDLRKELENRYFGQYDSKHGAWGFDQKFLEWNSAEYAMARARTGDKQSEQMARQSLNAQLNLVDPVWGGVYQYSVGGDWNEPHFEKIMAMQAGNLRIYSLAYEEWHDPAYLKAAQDVQRFLEDISHQPGRRILHQPGCGLDRRTTQRGVFQAGRCRPAQARHSANRQTRLCA